MGLIVNKKIFSCLILSFILFSLIDLWGFYQILVDPQFEQNMFAREIWESYGKNSVILWKIFCIGFICGITGFIYKRARVHGFIVIVIANLSLIYALISLYLV